MSLNPKRLKVAIVHDWLIGGGAERVVQALHEMFPDAPIYTSYASKEWQQRLDGKVVTGFLQRWPFSRLRKVLPLLRIWWFGRLNFKGYDLVISSSGNGEAFGITVPKGTVHITYCHSPVHYYWRHYEQYMKQPGFGFFDPLARLGLRLLIGPLRKWDLKAAQKPDYFIANSTHIQNDIKKYYGRSSQVIFPPVDTERFKNTPATKRSGFITVGRLAPFKRADLIVEACTRLRLPLTVIGNGPDKARLQKIAGPSVTFPDRYITDDEIPAYMAKSEAFLFASFEDFGITPVEALAAGTPVIAYRGGGALDYVKEGKTGLFFDEQSVGSLCSVLQQFDSSQFNPATIQKEVDRFSIETFKKQMAAFIEKSV